MAGLKVSASYALLMLCIILSNLISYSFQIENNTQVGDLNATKFLQIIWQLVSRTWTALSASFSLLTQVLYMTIAAVSYIIYVKIWKVIYELFKASFPYFIMKRFYALSRRQSRQWWGKLKRAFNKFSIDLDALYFSILVYCTSLLAVTNPPFFFLAWLVITMRTIYYWYSLISEQMNSKEEIEKSSGWYDYLFPHPEDDPEIDEKKIESSTHSPSSAPSGSGGSWWRRSPTVEDKKKKSEAEEQKEAGKTEALPGKKMKTSTSTSGEDRKMKESSWWWHAEEVDKGEEESDQKVLKDTEGAAKETNSKDTVDSDAAQSDGVAQPENEKPLSWSQYFFGKKKREETEKEAEKSDASGLKEESKTSDKSAPAERHTELVPTEERKNEEKSAAISSEKSSTDTEKSPPSTAINQKSERPESAAENHPISSPPSPKSAEPSSSPKMTPPISHIPVSPPSPSAPSSSPTVPPIKKPPAAAKTSAPVSQKPLAVNTPPPAAKKTLPNRPTPKASSKEGEAGLEDFFKLPPKQPASKQAVSSTPKHQAPKKGKEGYLDSFFS
jgi:hypothetical protein